jgi:hypothetical protein
VSSPLADVPVRRVLLFGCGFTFLLVGLAAVVFMAKAGDLLARALDGQEQRVTARLPEELGEAERTRLAWAFEDAGAAIRDGYADDAALDRVQRRLAALAEEPGRRLTRDEVAALTAELEAVAGRAAAPGPAASNS